MRTAQLLLLLTAAAASTAALPAPAVAARGMEVSVQDDLLFLHRGAARGQYFSRDTAFDRVRQMQGSSLRVNVVWAQAVADDQMSLPRKPKRVRYDWPAYDSLVRLARGYGVKVQFTLTGPSPAWATPKRKVSESAFRPNAREFAKFARAVARRYKGQVRRYSIWNEPNWFAWLKPGREGPRRYRELYRRSHREIKRVDRRAQVLIGELAPYRRPGHSMAPLKFMRGVTCVNRRYKPRKKRRACPGGALRADGFAHHPYDFANPPWRPYRGRDNVTIGSLGRLTRALDRMKRSRVLLPARTRRMPLYLTEFGYFRAGDKRRLPERRRAKWTVRGLRIAQRNPRVRQVVYYVFVRPPGGTFFDLSLLDHDGAQTRTYRAIVRWARKAARKRLIKRPGAKREGVFDFNPPPPPSGGPAPAPPPPPPPGEEPPPDPPCSIEFPGGPCLLPRDDG